MTTDHLPPVAKLREVLRLLAFDTDQIPLQGMTTDRQQTALAATAAAVSASTVSPRRRHDRTHDRLHRCRNW